MSQAIVHHRARDTTQPPTLTLLDILHNSLILANTAPYLSISSLVNLAATNKAFRHLLYQTPGVFRHLDLTQVKTAQFNIDAIDRGGQIWHNVQLDEYLTEDDFYSGPLRGVLSTLQRRNLLQDVQTLILDGLSVTADLCHELINDSTYSVRILSIRDVKNLNQGKLRGSLTYACRSTRPEGTPRLKALYFFGSKEAVPMCKTNTKSGQQSIGTGWNQRSQQTLTSSLQREPDAWWSKKGRIITRPITEGWANCLLACESLIAFDAVICRGPRHSNSPAFGNPVLQFDNDPAVATFALSGCAGCGKAPEGMTELDSGSEAVLPLLSPPPILSSSDRAATTPQHPDASFVPRCADCLRERYCATCHKWWCEACYQVPGQNGQDDVMIVDEDVSWNTLEDVEMEFAANKSKARISRSCWECGNSCNECIEETQKICKKCCGGYCIVHNEGSSATFCDWCVSRGRGLGQLKQQKVVTSQFPPVPIERRRMM